MQTVLVTGGAGYIGVAIAWRLAQHNFRVLLLDKAPLVYPIPGVKKFYQVDLLTQGQALDKIFTEQKISAVFHCAALTSVAESVVEPEKYYANNVTATLHLLEAMGKSGVKNFIFSSSAAVYAPQSIKKIVETSPLAPVSPYGKSKLFVEQILPDFEYCYGIKSFCLRYFNVAGAIFAPDFCHGEEHEPETHLIPLVCRKILRREPLEIFGFELASKDGSPVRDFVHVEDVANANLYALNFLQQHKTSLTCNVSSGRSTSVLQVVTAVEKLVKQNAIIKQNLPRPGDVVSLVGSNYLAKKKLQWQPEKSTLKIILQDSLRWVLKKY